MQERKREREFDAVAGAPDRELALPRRVLGDRRRLIEPDAILGVIAEPDKRGIERRGRTSREGGANRRDVNLAGAGDDRFVWVILY